MCVKLAVGRQRQEWWGSSLIVRRRSCCQAHVLPQPSDPSWATSAELQQALVRRASAAAAPGGSSSSGGSPVLHLLPWCVVVCVVDPAGDACCCQHLLGRLCRSQDAGSLLLALVPGNGQDDHLRVGRKGEKGARGVMADRGKSQGRVHSWDVAAAGRAAPRELCSRPSLELCPAVCCVSALTL